MAASVEDQNTVFNDDEIDDDDDTDHLIPDVVVDDEEDDGDGDSETDSDDADTNSTSSAMPTTVISAPPPIRPPPLASSSTTSASVTVAIPAASVPNGDAAAPLPPGIMSSNSTTLTTTTATQLPVTPDPKRQRIEDQLVISEKKRSVEDSRRLFQRLWTDEDEIELLQGFLEYTTQRGTASSGHHHDTATFYDQIKSKLQLDCNKNQLVEKLRRLKKKYRNVINRVISGKEFVFKSPHDQATFEISKKIWSNSAVHRQEFEDYDQQNPNPSSLAPNLPNLNHADKNMNHSSDNRAKMMMTTTTAIPNLNASTLSSANRARKRSRVKMEDNLNLNVCQNQNQNQSQRPADSVRNVNFGGYEAVLNVNSMQGLIDETVRNCLSPMLKDVVNNAVSGLGIVGGAGTASPAAAAGGGGGDLKGIGTLAMNAIPLNFSGLTLGTNGELVDERWRKQQILELEVYSKRLELVQDQIKSTLEELKSMGAS